VRASDIAPVIVIPMDLPALIAARHHTVTTARSINPQGIARTLSPEELARQDGFWRNHV